MWQSNFTQTIPGKPVDGIWYYDYNAVKQVTLRNTGKYDSMHCKNLDTTCVTFVDSRYTWVFWPELNQCCTLCSAADGCGIIKYNWLANATFEVSCLNRIRGVTF